MSNFLCQAAISSDTTSITANRVVKWYFNNHSAIQQRAAQFVLNTRDVKHSEDIWAKLITEAILSFNQGLESCVDPESRKAGKPDRVKQFHKAVDIVGEDAFRMIGFLVAAQGLNRSIDYWKRASTIYTSAMSNLKDQKMVFESSKQLYDLAKTPKLDPKVAQDIAGLAVDLQEKASAATAYSPGQPQVTFQGKRKENIDAI